MKSSPADFCVSPVKSTFVRMRTVKKEKGQLSCHSVTSSHTFLLHALNNVLYFGAASMTVNINSALGSTFLLAAFRQIRLFLEMVNRC